MLPERRQHSGARGDAPLRPLLEAFDHASMQEFLKARELVAIRDHFFVRNEVSYLAVLVTYGPRTHSPALGDRPAFLQGKIRGATSPKGPLVHARAVFGGGRSPARVSVSLSRPSRRDS